jgi:exosortase/archaeosortase family protein
VFAVRILLRVVGIPAYFQSNELHLPAGVLAVEGGCSGLHFFVVAMAIATLYWRLTAMKRPVVLFVLAASLAILSNWLRVFAIAVAGYLTNMQHYLVRVEHYRFGWVVFAMGMAGFFFIAGRMDGTARPQPPLSPAGVDTLKSNPQWVVIVVLALAVGPVAHWGLKLRDQNTALDRETLAAPSGWSIAPEPASTWQPKFANADFSDVTRYARTATTIEVFRAKYVDQRQDKKLAGYGNSVLGAGYQDEADESAAQVLPGFSRTIMRDFKGRKWLVLHTYYVGQRAFASPVPAQVFYGISSIFTPEPVGVLAARSECAPNCDAAAALLSDFIRVLPSDLRLSPASAGKSAE